MLLRMLELNDPERYPITRVIFADTNFEFPEMYEYIDRVSDYIAEKYTERGLTVERVYAKKTWDEWFFGRVVSGKNKGIVRGPPMAAFPCWWAREAKVYPLQRATKGAKVQYVGIAIDESKRVSKHAERDGIRYPLIEWGWTEEDAFRYLDKIGMVNPLYTNFVRLGCFHCIKQSATSWYILWRRYPELWAQAKEWDEKGFEVSGRGLARYESLEDMQKRFENGYIPDGKRPFECNSCDAVSIFHNDQQGIVDTWGEGEELHTDEVLACGLEDVLGAPNEALLKEFKWKKKSEAEPQEWW